MADQSGSDPIDVEALGALELSELRAVRARLQHEDDVVSYVRRIAQARLDLARWSGDDDSAGADRDITGELQRVLTRQLVGGPARPPRPDEVSVHDSALVADLEAVCARFGFSRLDELTADERSALIDALEGFEAEVSADRRARFEMLDALSAELVRRYRDGEATVDLGADDDR
jgi:hypothetical protein